MGAQYGFPVEEVYDTIDEILAWARNALKTADELLDEYQQEVLDLLPGIPEAIADLLLLDPLDYAKLGLDLLDLLREILSDPIVLDLDGDGIELTPLASSATLFDLDGDGVAERAGWASPHDGLLVHDANGNGLVDGVGELFGSANVDGYDELRTLDANSDGRIDASDPAFAQFLVWRDLNADGISTAAEMLTLAQAGITRFNLGYTQTNTEVEGNIIARTGSYVRTDGSSRTMASVKFALDESGSIPNIPEDADISDLIVLPNLPGMLALPSLTIAMFFDPTLKGMVEDLVLDNHDFDTFADFEEGGFLDVIYRWAGVDTSVPLEPSDPPYHVQALAAFMGRPFDELNQHQLERLEEEVWPQFVKQMGVQFLFQAAKNPALQPLVDLSDGLAALDPDSPTFDADVAALTETALAAAATITPAYDYLERFTGLAFNPLTGEISGDFEAFVADFMDDQPALMTFTTLNGSGRPTIGAMDIGGDDRHPWTAWYEDQGSLLFYIADAMGIDSDHVLTVTGWRWLTGTVADLDGTSGNDLIDEVVSITTQLEWTWNGHIATNVPTHDQRIFGYEGNDELRGNDGVDRLVGGAGDDLLKGGSDSDMYVYASGDGLDRIIETSGTADTIYFSSELDRANLQVSRIAGTNDLQLHFGNLSSGIILTNQWSSPGQAIDHIHFVAEDGLDSGDIASLYLVSLATSGADTITGSWAAEEFVGLDGNDTLSGADGNDILRGGAGDDKLNGNNHNDALYGESGNDALDGGSGDDVLAGGGGNDTLIGWKGNDTYVFNLGDGQDIIQDFWDTGSGGTDTVIFGSDILPADIVVTQVNNGTDILLSIAGTSDSILLDNSIYDSDYRIEQVQFANGTVLSHAELMSLATTPTSDDDILYGSYDAETLQGGAGNDTLNARGGNDTVIGGAGNDTLIGWNGNDIYVFNLGDGQDVIRDFWDVGSGGTDTVLFGAGILPSDVMVAQINNDTDFLLSINGTSDTVLLDNSISDSDYRIEQVQFADGTLWTHQDLYDMALGQQLTGEFEQAVLWQSSEPAFTPARFAYMADFHCHVP